MSRRFQIEVLPGDGIGVDVTREAVRVQEAVASRIDGLEFRFREHSVGAEEFLRNGDPLPESAFDACRSADAVLLGAMGLPNVRWPDGRELTPQIDIRERLDLYFGVRPIHLYAPEHSPLKGHGQGEIDFVIIRESTEGLFAGRHDSFDRGGVEVRDTMRITRSGAERVIHAAFRLAMKRRKHVTLVDKANVLPSMVFFRSVFDDVARNYPEVETARAYVDAAALYLVQRPQTFDVIVTENMFGDILSDLAAGLVGGLGMAPSADIGDDCAVFQPTHGTAPDIAGKGIANPTAAILSAAMMLEWLDEPETNRGAALIRQGVQRALSNPRNATPDLRGTLKTTELTDQILQAIVRGTP
jgi:3-isopropylmalate dehydrogenase